MSEKIKVAMFDTQEYDQTSFENSIANHEIRKDIEFVYFNERLTPNSLHKAYGFPALCLHVNDDGSGENIKKLAEHGLKIILMRSAGFDRIDLKTAEQLKIPVVRVPAYSPNAVAEYAVALLLTLNRHVHQAVQRVRMGNYNICGFLGFDLYKKTVGVIGTGKIGQCFINIMLGFGCNILCYDLYPNEELKKLPNVEYVEPKELFEKSDIISLHAPATKETIRIINKESIDLMKPGVFIINTARGVLIDTKALIDGILSKKIGGAGLDVYENEGKYFFQDHSAEEIDDELLVRLQNMKNVILTSHQAFLTQEALKAIATVTMQSLKEFFIEKKPIEQLTYRITA